MTLKYGGFFLSDNNLNNEPSLDYILEIVKSEIFCVEAYPEIHQKAAVYLYKIIKNHIFNDGNKRTGLEAAILFLEKNQFKISDDISDDEIIEFTLEVAKGNVTLEEVSNWLERIIIKKEK